MPLRTFMCERNKLVQTTGIREGFFCLFVVGGGVVVIVA